MHGDKHASAMSKGTYLFRTMCSYSEQQKPSHTDSNMATPLAPMLPLGVTPRPPIKPAQRSLKQIITYKNHTMLVSKYNN